MTPRRRTRPRSLPAALAGLAAATALLLAGCALGAPPPDQTGQAPTFPSPSDQPSSLADSGDSQISVLAANLPQPWGIAFLPDGSGLVTERNAGQIIQLGQPPTDDGLTRTPFARITGLSTVGDGGLLGIAVSPHYATDHKVFVYYSTATDNRVASITSGGTPTVLVKGIPHGATDNGGGLAFGPDGYLYASTGDAGRPTAKTALGGKILRMTTAGKPAPGNPTPASLVYASGFHNVEGLAWDAQKNLYVIDASAAADNLDVVLRGHDYGWPAGHATGAQPNDVAQPVQTFPLDQSGCSGITVIDNAVVTACLTGKRLWMVEVNANGTTFGAPKAAVVNTYGRLRAVVAAADGSLWVSTSNTDGHGTPGADDDQILQIVLADVGAGVT